MVLAVIGGLGLLVLPRLSAVYQAGRLKTEARRVVGVVRLARSEAVTTGRLIDLTAETKKGRLTIRDGETEISTCQLDDRARLEEVKVRGQSDARSPIIFFWPDGRVSEAAIYLSGGGRRVTLHLEPLTGRVEALEGRVGYDWSSG